MQAVSIKRTDIRRYTPKFTRTSKMKEVTNNKEIQEELKQEVIDDKLFPIVKLLYAMYVQS